MQPLIMMFVLFMSYGVVYNTIQCHWHPMIVDRVIDGDTVALLAPMLPVPLNITGLHLRIRGVDCAETGGRARCDSESKLGEAAKVFTFNAIHTQPPHTPVQTLICGWTQNWDCCLHVQSQCCC